MKYYIGVAVAFMPWVLVVVIAISYFMGQRSVESGTSVADVLATSTVQSPTDTVEAAIDDIHYLKVALVQTNALHDAAVDIHSFMNKTEDMGDQQLIDGISTDAAKIRTAYEEVLNLSPPTNLVDSNTRIVAVAKSCSDTMEILLRGLKSDDIAVGSPDIVKSVPLINQCVNQTDELDRMLKSNNL